MVLIIKLVHQFIKRSHTVVPRKKMTTKSHHNNSKSFVNVEYYIFLRTCWNCFKKNISKICIQNLLSTSNITCFLERVEICSSLFAIKKKYFSIIIINKWYKFRFYLIISFFIANLANFLLITSTKNGNKF